MAEGGGRTPTTEEVLELLRRTWVPSSPSPSPSSSATATTTTTTTKDVRSEVVTRIASSTNAYKHDLLGGIAGPVVVDIGFGRGGDFGRYLQNEKIRRVYAVEPNPQHIREAQRRWVQFSHSPAAVNRARRGCPLEIVFLSCCGTDFVRVLDAMRQRGDVALAHLDIVLMNSFTFFCVSRLLWTKFCMAINQLRGAATSTSLHILCMVSSSLPMREWVSAQHRFPKETHPHILETPDRDAVCGSVVDVSIPGSIVGMGQREGAVVPEKIIAAFAPHGWGLAVERHGIPFRAPGVREDRTVQMFLNLFSYFMFR